MARTAYIRVSTAAQTYDRQLHDFKQYFERMGMNWDGIEVVSEKITSHTEFTQRKIYPVLKKAKEGDIIYACQLDRLGRTVSDILNLIDYADEKGVTIITINDGSTISKKTPTGRMVLTVLAAVAQMERDLRDERGQSGVDAAISDIKKNGHRVTKRGTIQSHWGNQKGCDMSAAQEASIRSKQDAVIAWREESAAYKWVINQIRKGKTRKTVVSEFNELHAQQPSVYCTRQGKPLSEAVLSKWIAMSNLMAI